MTEEEFYEKLRKEIIPYFEPNDDLHGWTHVQRVLRSSEEILQDYFSTADPDVIKTSVYLHDIANPMEMRSECRCHAEEGAKMARYILGGKNVSNNLIDEVCYAISVHRVSNGLRAETIEAKILQDADRLDVLGALSVARCFDWSSQKRIPYYVEGFKPRDSYDGSPAVSTIHHMQEKILKLTPNKFNTPRAQLIAKGRYKFVKQFVNQFIKEWGGEL